MKTSAKGRAFITKEEGFRTKAYQDTRGIWTIGVGHTTAAGPPAVTKGLVLTKAEVDELFAKDVIKYENYVNKYVTYPVTQNQFDALVSLCINIGPGGFDDSSVVKKLNAGDIQGAADAFLLWKKAGNDKDILLPRRQRERKLFLTPDGKSTSTTPAEAITTATKVTKNAAKKTPIATSTIIATGTAGASGLLSSIGSWEAVAALTIIIIVGCAAYIIWKRTQREDEK